MLEVLYAVCDALKAHRRYSATSGRPSLRAERMTAASLAGSTAGTGGIHRGLVPKTGWPVLCHDVQMGAQELQVEAELAVRMRRALDEAAWSPADDPEAAIAVLLGLCHPGRVDNFIPRT